MTKEQTIQELLTRGVADVIVREDFEKKLLSGDKLRLKLGIDPTGADLHIGHAVVLRKMRALQDMGHEVVIVVGDYTARIGDPTGRDKMREPMTHDLIKKNLKHFERQALKVLDKKKTSFEYQSKWFDKLTLAGVLELAEIFTVQQFLERDMFEKRIKDGQPIGVHEFMYPLMQGYDSVAIEADVEFGGSDQLFNNLAGRPIQQHFGQTPQNVLVTTLLEGLDGRKMSKTYDNFVAIEAEPNDMYGKVMTLKDELIPTYFEIATDVPMEDVATIKEELASGANPRDGKMRLAREIVTMFHDEKAAQAAEEAFVNVFQKKQKPDEIEEVSINADTMPLGDLLVETGLAKSKSEAKRLVQQGGVRVNDEVQSDIAAEIEIATEPLLQVGKRHFRQVKKG